MSRHKGALRKSICEFQVLQALRSALMQYWLQGKMEGNGPDGVSLYGLNLLVFGEMLCASVS